MKLLFVALLLIAAPAAGESGSFQRSAVPPHPALYSFADVVRLTVAGPMSPLPSGEAAAEAPVRVAVARAPGGPEPRFAVRAVPQPDKWMLALAGLLLAGWVAHRRLSNSL
jgi:hypothetical protein